MKCNVMINEGTKRCEISSKRYKLECSSKMTVVKNSLSWYAKKGTGHFDTMPVHKPKQNLSDFLHHMLCSFTIFIQHESVSCIFDTVYVSFFKFITAYFFSAWQIHCNHFIFCSYVV